MALDELSRLSHAEGMKSVTYDHPAEAIAAFRSRLFSPNEALLVTGSLFLVAEVRDYLLANRQAA